MDTINVIDDGMSYAGDDQSILGANIARKRRELGMSQTALAIEMRSRGISHWHQATVSRIELGKQPLGVREVQVLNSILGDITIGTGAQEALVDLQYAAGGLRDRIFDRRLEQAEAALTMALDDLQWMREALAATEAQRASVTPKLPLEVSA